MRKQAEDVRNVIANRYFELNDIYEVRDAKGQGSQRIRVDR